MIDETGSGTGETPMGEVATPPPGAGDAPKAELGKRFVAAIIDAVIAVVVGFIPLVGGLAATAYWLVRDGMDLDFMDRRSIGKRLVKIRPVRLDGAPMDVATSMKRNWMFALGGIAQLLAFTIIGLFVAIPLFLVAFVIGIVEIVLVVVDPDSRRLGDKLAVTRVVETDS
ncbi:MAG TPA: RDD family protein [Acidobacteria bacterium]|nr:RDD family protein [Acidobacteriota bacterium]